MATAVSFCWNSLLLDQNAKCQQDNKTVQMQPRESIMGHHVRQELNKLSLFSGLDNPILCFMFGLVVQSPPALKLFDAILNKSAEHLIYSDVILFHVCFTTLNTSSHCQHYIRLITSYGACFVLYCRVTIY